MNEDAVTKQDIQTKDQLKRIADAVDVTPTRSDPEGSTKLEAPQQHERLCEGSPTLHESKEGLLAEVKAMERGEKEARIRGGSSRSTK
jgi:hypothetical protein